MFLKSLLLSTGFLPNDRKSIWQPTPCLAWLGLRIDLSSCNISTTPKRTSSDEHVIHTIHAQHLFSTVGKLACFVARIISRGSVVSVLSELRYKVAYNPNTFFVNWKQRTAGKAVEDALQYIKMYEAGV